MSISESEKYSSWMSQSGASQPDGLDTSGRAELDREQTELQQAAFDRAVQFERDNLLFEHGRVSAEHPGQMYLTELINRLPHKGEVPNVILPVEWKTANAMALPDGTIFATQRLALEAGSEEELIGILAHESVHAARKHVEQTVNLSKQERSARNTTARIISQKRMQEYEADLRATVELLSEAGISPIGLKNFFEKQAAKEHSGGWVHGDSIQRALNIGSALHLLDLGEVTDDLTPVNKDALIAPDPGVGLPALAVIGKDTSRFGDAYRRKIQQSRQELLPNLTEAQKRLGAHKIYANYSRVQDVKGVNQDDVMFLSKLLPSFSGPESGLDSKNSLDEDYKKILEIELLYGVRILSDLFGLVKKHTTQAVDRLNTLDDFERLRQCLRELAEEKKVAYSLITSTDLWLDIIYIANQKKLFEVEDSSENPLLSDAAAGRAKFISDWAETLTFFSSQMDKGVIFSSKVFEGVAKSELIISSKQKFKNPQTKFFGGIKVSPEGVVYNKVTGENLEMYLEDLPQEAKQWIAEVVENGRKPSFNKAFTMSRPDLEMLFGEKGLSEVVSIINSIQVGVQEFCDREYLRLIENFKHNRNIQDSPEATYLFQNNLLVKYAPFQLLRQCLDELPQFAQFNDSQKTLFLFSTGRRIDLKDEVIKSITVQKLPASHKTAEGEVVAQLNEIDDPSIVFSSQFTAFEQVYPFLINPSRLPADLAHKFKDIHFGRNRDYRTTETLLVVWLDRYLADKDFPDFFKVFEQWKSQGIDVVELIVDYPSCSGRINLKLAQAVKSDNLHQLSPKQIFILSSLIPNAFLQTGFESLALRASEQSDDFDSKVDIFFPEPGQHGLNDMAAREEFVDQNVNTRDTFFIVKKRMEAAIDSLLAQGNVAAGIGVLLDMYRGSHENTHTLIQALLKSGYDDKSLKEFIYETCLGVSEMGVDDSPLYKAADRKKKKIKRVSSLVTQSESIMRVLYATDEMGKELLLRKLLAGPTGVLPEQKNREKFLTSFLADILTADEKNPADKDLLQVIENIKSVLATLPEWQLLYFGLRGVLMENICRPPKVSTPWAQIYAVELDLDGAGIKESERKSLFTNSVWTNIPHDVETDPEKHASAYALFAEDQLTRELNKKGDQEVSVQERISPLRFVKEVVSRTGGLGVRFLQQLPLIAEVSPEQSKEFSEVYDQVTGQSKLAALALLEREWPELWQEMESVNKRIGGGSMVTVYEAKSMQGGTEVIKVRNPNIHYHVNEMYRFACQVLDRLAREHGGTYKSARLLLDDIKKWIDNDLSFANFLKEDALFRDGSDEQRGYQGFQPDGFTYKIKIPLSKGPENPYFSREEKIDGLNLTKWDELVAAGHDMKQIVSLLVRCYGDQIMQGMCLSDVHPGNFAVTTNNELAVYDRNYFIHLSYEERALILSLVQPGGEQKSKEDLLVNYIAPKATLRDKAGIKKLSSELLGALSVQDSLSAQKILIQIRQQPGVTIPLSFTLIIKNLHGLQMMARQAGFSGGVTEAFAFTP